MSINSKLQPKIPDSVGNAVDVNNYFGSIFDARNIPTDTIDHYNNNKFEQNHNFSFRVVTNDDILTAISELKSDAKGNVGISLTMLKMCLPVIFFIYYKYLFGERSLSENLATSSSHTCT